MQNNEKLEERKPKLLGPGIFRWGGDLPRQDVLVFLPGYPGGGARKVCEKKT